MPFFTSLSVPGASPLPPKDMGSPPPFAACLSSLGPAGKPGGAVTVSSPRPAAAEATPKPPSSKPFDGGCCVRSVLCPSFGGSCTPRTFASMSEAPAPPEANIESMPLAPDGRDGDAPRSRCGPLAAARSSPPHPEKPGGSADEPPWLPQMLLPKSPPPPMPPSRPNEELAVDDDAPSELDLFQESLRSSMCESPFGILPPPRR
mmetsp:Transcript_9736/g.28569  ORF Transcript_9736/g.28569 Transcript_9736/m.28569 type:complete len:204 (+) Transcript_9736:445-1056(+)